MFAAEGMSREDAVGEAFIHAIRALDRSNVEDMLADASLSQRYLDCGLHEIATGQRDDEAAKSARLTIATQLVSCGADPDNRQHGCGGTPLHHTLAGGYTELVDFLLTAKADVNAANRYGACSPRSMCVCCVAESGVVCTETC